MNEYDDNELMKAAAKLATEIPPGRDLWPDIEASINAPRQKQRLPWFAQAAAVILLVGASSAITYVMTRSETGASSIASNGNLVLTQASFGGEFELSADYKLARSDLLAQLDDRLAVLSPESRQGVERNLEIIRTAINEINAELEKAPDNVLLQDLLLDTYQQELTVMRNIGGLAHSVMSRNDI